MWKHDKLDAYIKNDAAYLAHLDANDKNRTETLEQHSDLVFSYFLKMIEKKQLDAVFSNFMQQLGIVSDKGQVIFKELVANTIYFHDFGKINKLFQSDKMQQKIDKKGKKYTNNSNHSIYSSAFYLDAMWQRTKPSDERAILQTLIVINAYIISKHHGSLDNNCYLGEYCEFSEFSEKMKNARSAIVENTWQFEAYIKPFGLEDGQVYQLVNKVLKGLTKNKRLKDIGYYYTRFLYSLLVSADFYATTDFMFKTETTDFGIMENCETYKEAFEKTPIYQSIQKYQKAHGNSEHNDSDMNDLRAKLFLETEVALQKNMHEKMFYLEAPTGSGKTNISINLALTLIEQTKVNKIFYIFPYNTLVEQTESTLKNVFGDVEDVNNRISVVNSLTAYKNGYQKDEKEVILLEEDYAFLLQQRQFLHYPITLTTHVNLFSYLFGTKRDNHFPLWQLANSVIILDEIQSYRNSIWTEVIYFLDRYADLLNIKIIIMSATLPDLKKLISTDTKYVRLNKNADFYLKHPIFKKRVRFKDTLLRKTSDTKLDKTAIFEILHQQINKLQTKGNKKILIEFMIKKDALNFYQMLHETVQDCDCTLEVITGDDNLLERKRIIDKVKAVEKIILVATQVIEAGVDIDMDAGLKQVSLFDSEEQFAGRINRSAKKQQAEIYFFTMGDINIYKKDIRSKERFQITQSEMFQYLKEKEFSKYYNQILAEIKAGKEHENDDNFQKFKDYAVNGLAFSKIEAQMQLIEEREEFTLVLVPEKDSEEMLKAWETMELLNLKRRDKTISYSNWKVEITNLYVKLGLYSYRVAKYYNTNLNLSSSKKIGNWYLFLDADEYFEHGKFIRERLNDKIGETFEIL